MSTERRLSVSTGQDILSYIPHALGYWPVRSLVCITMTGKTVGATLRVDLPASGRQKDRDYLLAFARHVHGYLRADETADGVLLAVFGGQDWLTIRPVPEGGLMAALQKACTVAGTPVKDSWYVGPKHWRNYRCTDASCCGWPGRPLTDITESKLNAELIYRGSSYAPDPPDGIVPVPECGPAGSSGPRSGICARQKEYAEQLSRRPHARTQFQATMEVWELAMSRWPAAPDAATSGFLLASLESLTVRDAVLVSCSVSVRAAVQGAAACGLLAAITTEVILPHAWRPTPSEREALRARFEAQPGSSAGAAEEFGAAEFGAVLMGESGNRPDWCRIDGAAGLLDYLARAASGEPEAGALTMLGWISWCRGRSSAADGYLRQALNAVPEYRLAGLLRELIGRGYLCGWAKRRSTSWQGQEPDAAQGAA